MCPLPSFEICLGSVVAYVVLLTCQWVTANEEPEVQELVDAQGPDHVSQAHQLLQWLASFLNEDARSVRR